MTWLNRTHIGDCRELLSRMAAEGVRVQTCVTSPPYFGLRDYGTARWEGGEASCDHGAPSAAARATRPAGKLVGSTATVDAGTVMRGDCHCGARRIDSQIGLEDTPGAYVEQLVSVFAAVREVLADDGTLWLNLGDSYSSGLTGAGGQGSTGAMADNSIVGARRINRGAMRADVATKNLFGIPWRVAFALQADGWYLRSDIIWHKPNPMPESVTDRPTKSHEYLFLLSKRADYYYDAASIVERAATAEDKRDFLRTEKRSVAQHKQAALGRDLETSCLGTNEPFANRNRRTVWTVPTQPFTGAHFACFPPALIEPCILAGSPPGAIVLDPFMGSGTTGQVATNLGRQFIGCELNPKYVALHEMRTTTQGMAI